MEQATYALAKKFFRANPFQRATTATYNWRMCRRKPEQATECEKTFVTKSLIQQDRWQPLQDLQWLLYIYRPTQVQDIMGLQWEDYPSSIANSDATLRKFDKCQLRLTLQELIPADGAEKTLLWTEVLL